MNSLRQSDFGKKGALGSITGPGRFCARRDFRPLHWHMAGRGDCRGQDRAIRQGGRPGVCNGKALLVFQMHARGIRGRTYDGGRPVLARQARASVAFAASTGEGGVHDGERRGTSAAAGGP